MNPLQSDTGNVDLWRLTAEQRQQIYEEEKRRIEQAAPAVSRRAMVIAGVYILGCLLIYFGVANAAIDFWGTRTWNLKPEPGFFESLVDSVVTLIRPFLAVVLTFWAVAIPVGVVWGLWLWGADIVGFVKRLVNKDHRDNG
jgi:hypothetical protein